jgi:hypothetical protein
MAHADNQISISKPPQVVYNFLADGLNNLKWRDGVLEIKLKSGVSGTEGAEYAQILKGPGGRKIDGDYKLIEAQPTSIISFLVTTGPARPVGRFVISPAQDGTMLKFSLDYKPRGLKRILEPMIVSTMKTEVAYLAKLKQVLETT